MIAPKYQRIATTLRKRYRASPEGERLPSERSLAAEFDVSLMTVRQALNLLQDDGLVLRVLGKGTFVRHGVIAKGNSLTSFTEEMRVKGLEPSTRLLGVEFVRPDDDAVRALQLSRNERVLWMERLRLADGEPICVEVSQIPERLADGLIEAGERSLHEALAANDARPMTAERRIRATLASDREARILRVPPQDAILNIRHLFADGKGRLVQLADSSYRADRYQVLGTINRPTS